MKKVLLVVAVVACGAAVVMSSSCKGKDDGDAKTYSCSCPNTAKAPASGLTEAQKNTYETECAQTNLTSLAKGTGTPACE